MTVAWVGLVGVLVGALAGYYFRRHEELRTTRRQAYAALVDASLRAAESAATMLTVHMFTGWPHDLSNVPDDDRTRITGEWKMAHR